MVCKSCGKPVQATDKFCPYCGAPSPAVPETSAPQSAPVTQAPVYNGAYTSGSTGTSGAARTSTAPKYSAPKKSIGKLPLIIGGAVAAVALVILIIVLILTGSPKAKVASALASTGKEFTQMADTLGLTNLGQVLTKESASHKIDVTMDGGDLDGLGVTLLADVNVGKHEVGFKATPYYGEVELCNVMVTAKEEMIYFGMPEILPEPYYGFSTKTLMEDLDNLGADVGDFDEVSFNIFEIIEEAQKQVEEDTKEAQKAVEESVAALADAMEVEKAGSKSVRVNGSSTKCTHYEVVIPEDAIEDILKAYEDYLSATDMEAIVEMVCDSMGLPSDIADEVMYELGNPDPNLDVFFDLLDEIGDLEMDVYISGGKISVIEYEGEIYGDDIELSIQIGGGDNYIDDISMTLSNGYTEITLESSGNHTGKGGVFTDETVIGDGYDDFEFVTEYETKGDHNLTFSMELSGQTMVELEGQYLAKADSLTLNLEELSLDDGEMTMALNYSISAYKRNVKESKPVLLSKLDEDDLMDIAEEVADNAEDWLYDLYDEIPELQYLAYYF